jgi:hypothetical protein
VTQRTKENMAEEIFKASDKGSIGLRLKCPAQNQAVLPAHVVGMVFYFNCLHNHSVHVVGFAGQNLSILELDVMAMVESVLCYYQLLRLSELDVAVVFL